MAQSDTSMVPVKGQTAVAWAVVAAIVLVAALILIVSAFSQNNDPSSVDGHSATTSHNLP